MTAFAIDFGKPSGDDSFLPITEKGISHHPVIRLRPPGLGGSAAVGLAAASYVDHYEKAVAECGVVPRALLGYCSGGIFAYELGARLRAHGHADIPVVLFDTLPTDARHVVDEFVRSMRDMSWSEETTFGIDVPLAGESALAVLERDLAGGVAFLEGVTGEFIKAFLTARGVDDDALAALSGVMLSRHSAYLRYVAASTVRADSRFDDAAYVIVSKSLSAAAQRSWAATGVRVQIVNCEHRDLLRSDAAYRHLLSYVGSALTGR